MSFLSSAKAESIRSKLGFPRISAPAIFGLALVGMLVLFFAGQAFWNAFTVPEVTVVSSEQSEEGSSTEQTQPKALYVHVVGAVKSPGLYALHEGDRVEAAVAAAGGFTDEANQQSVNLARELIDGEQVLVASTAQTETSASVDGSSTQIGSDSGTTGKVNINTADAEALKTLDGVGDATAAKIIDYRTKNGPFKSIDGIKEVSGIGEKRFEAIKDAITI